MSLWRSKYPQAEAPFTVAIVAAEFNDTYVDAMLESCCRGLRRSGIDDGSIHVFRVPGSFELPFAAQKAVEASAFDGIITLGVVIRGDTIHFELVADNAARGIGNVGLRSGIPVIFGVLACDTAEQVEARIELGEEFARSLVTMMNLVKKGFDV